MTNDDSTPRSRETPSPIPQEHRSSREVYHVTADADLSDIDAAKLKEMVDQSGYIGCMGVVACLNALVALFCIVIWSSHHVDNPGPFIFVGLCLAYFVFVVYGCFKRPRLGRVGGMSLCILLLPLFPIGTWMGIVGLAAFIKGRAFFGPDRVTHARLEAEFKRREKRTST